ncbi:MAG: tRNA (adenosine(37)-N6)-threonylcarbamoyltransferase complex ATPase subunit type 1 TsaE [bacterium]
MQINNGFATGSTRGAPSSSRGESLCAHMKFISSSEKQTFIFAEKFSKKLTGGETIGLVGDLGAGKTVFAKGLAAGLGIKKNISSPTFVLMKIYPVKKHQQIKFLIHIDAYRIKKRQDIIAIGAGEYFNNPEAITIIEWADKIKKILPRKTNFVKIKINGRERTIYF